MKRDKSLLSLVPDRTSRTASFEGESADPCSRVADGPSVQTLNSMKATAIAAAEERLHANETLSTPHIVDRHKYKSGCSPNAPGNRRVIASTIALWSYGFEKNLAPVGRWLALTTVLPDATINFTGGQRSRM